MTAPRALLLVSFLLAAACAGAGSGPRTGGEHGAEVPGPGRDSLERSARQIMVTLSPGPERARLATEIGQVYGLATVYGWTIETLGELCVVYEVPPERTTADLLRVLAGERRLLSAQPVHPYRVLADRAEDPYRHLQHGLGAIGLAGAHGAATGHGVSVALIDTGVAIDHPDLAGRVARVGNFVDRGERTFTKDVHGTAVAGVLAAGAANGIGIAGVAPGADVYAYKACWHGSGEGAVCNSYTLARAVDAALSDRARVLNLSVGGPADPLLRRMLQAAIRRGTVVVAAFDESRADGGFPAALEGVIRVRATDLEGSVRGPRHGPVALAAPGVDVLSTTPGGGYDFFSGSSLAAAHVSGTVALLLERWPDLGPARVAAILHAGARQVGEPSANPGPAARALDVCGALAHAAGTPVCDDSADGRDQR